MLTLTPTAAQVVRDLLASAPIDEDGGIRITLAEATADTASLQISLVDGPELADEAVEDEGVHVYLEPELAEFLDDKVLDAELDHGHLAFAIRDQFDPNLNGGRRA